MSIDEMISACRRQQELRINIGKTNCGVMFRVPGRWGKLKTRRLFRFRFNGMANPVGEIIAEEPGGVLLVEFKAQEVLDACHAILMHR